MQASPSHPSARWTRVLLVASAVFALQGASWVFIGSVDPVGWYQHRLAEALIARDALEPDAQRVFRFAAGLVGATTAGFFVLFHLIVRHPFARGEAWAHQALSAALGTWFVLDSGVSFWCGAAFNVWLVNVPCLIVLGVPLVATAGSFRGNATPGSSPSRLAPRG